MNWLLIAVSAAGFSFALYAWIAPHWPNPAAARLAWEAAKLTRCHHRAYHWAIERTEDGWLLVRCGACDRARKSKPLDRTRLA